MKIYVAGPYNADSEACTKANVEIAIAAGIRILQAGHTPFIPHLTHYVEMYSKQIGAGLSYEDYLAWDREWLLCCEAILYLAPSPGADREMAWAEEHGLRVFSSLSEIPLLPRGVDHG